MECGELVYAYILTDIFQNSCRRGRMLLEHFTYPSEIFLLGAGGLKELGLPEHQAVQILDRRNIEKARREIGWLQSAGVQILYIKDRNYPCRLKECPDAPILLFYKGNADLNTQRVLSMVGTRKMTAYGASVCRNLIQALSRLSPAPLIVSGLAYGVDICAHRAALDCGMDTVGVMATGMDSIYPAGHRSTACRMVAQGGLVTDFPRKSLPRKSHFIRRNRIIAGLADAVVLVESAERGGGMITCRLAASYSREVFAVPGRMQDEYSRGCLQLVQEHTAAILSSPDALIRALGWETGYTGPAGAQRKIWTEEDGPEAKAILNALASADGPLPMDELHRLTGIEAGELSYQLTLLEMAGRIVPDLNRNYTLY